MSLKTKIRKEGQVTVVDLDGFLDYQFTKPFKDKCKAYIKTQKSGKATTDESGDKIIFNFKNLEFIGSTNISEFIKTLKEFNTGGNKPKYCGLKSEFVKLFKAYEGRKYFDIYENLDSAIKSFDSDDEGKSKT